MSFKPISGPSTFPVVHPRPIGAMQAVRGSPHASRRIGVGTALAAIAAALLLSGCGVFCAGAAASGGAYAGGCGTSVRF
ncbi:hypothetical protein [Paraburkholderia sp. BR14320]|uniref:hypothetical protein n=1 Tax=unclassified Paraburkholderia TaxID=2615204 RepID=UPI0034CD45F2